ncbi:3H domain-containing protein [Methanobrevibacter oralis]|uniref:3H domain-containing protein n=1 Tax=Methanobrevibacter oralis TaxID=66851 RepID=UPI001C736003|nr:3H domain-containing protein [Methanobrevibacter oralis]
MLYSIFKDNQEQKEAVDDLYKCVNNIHSHWISGPDKAIFKKMIEELSQKIEIIGQDLTDKEIANLTKKIKSKRVSSLE